MNLPKLSREVSVFLRRKATLHCILEYGSIFFVILCSLSLISWFLEIQSFVIVKPFAALVFLVSSPFVYWMGRAARRENTLRR